MFASFLLRLRRRGVVSKIRVRMKRDLELKPSRSIRVMRFTYSSSVNRTLMNLSRIVILRLFLLFIAASLSWFAGARIFSGDFGAGIVRRRRQDEAAGRGGGTEAVRLGDADVTRPPILHICLAQSVREPDGG